MNGIGILKLVQDKKLDLNTDINDYLESWKFPYDEKTNNKKITITNLLSHTAGLGIHGFPGYSVNDTIPTLQHILDEIVNSVAITYQWKNYYQPVIK